jgi:hypothetical protein
MTQPIQYVPGQTLREQSGAGYVEGLAGLSVIKAQLPTDAGRHSSCREVKSKVSVVPVVTGEDLGGRPMGRERETSGEATKYPGGFVTR